MTLLFPECQQRVNGRRPWEAFEAWLSLSECYASASGQVPARLDRAFEVAASPRWKSNAASFAFSPCLMFFLSLSFPPCITCIIIFSSCIRLVGSLSDACRSETDCDILCASNPEFPFLLFFSFYFISFLIPFLQLLGGHKISRSPGMFYRAILQDRCVSVVCRAKNTSHDHRASIFLRSVLCFCFGW
jgi:hypothetical protein